MTADALPTWQTNGIVWSMAEAGGVIFAGGTFSAIRPPDAPAGSDERPAMNFVALNAATGEPTSCTLSFTVGSGLATVRALAVSPDHKTLYAGGRFGAVNGVKVSNVAAIDLATCAPRNNFKVAVNATVRALATAGGNVYLGGDFTSVAGRPRRYFASVTEAGALRSWKANADEVGRAVEVTPNGRDVLLGGDFFHLNGADSHALAVVSSATGSLTKRYPLGFFPAPTVVKDIATDSTGFYTAQEGNPLEGRIAFRLSDFNQRWRDTCLGATQAVTVFKGVLYSGSHTHSCAGAFPNRTRQHLLAQSVNGPALLGWYPDTNDGLGEHIGPRVLTTATANGRDYLWAGGEFTKVNGLPQQGLTRFASGPDTGAPSVPQVNGSSTTRGRIDVRWQASLDPDDRRLTYRVYRDGSDKPIHTVTGSSIFWRRPQLTFTDTHVSPGSTYTYRVTASDGTNTSASSTPVKVTAATASNRYAQQVVADRPLLYWRFEETGGTFAADTSGTNNGGNHRGGPARGVAPGAVAGSHAAVGYGGADEYTYSDRAAYAPASYTLEAWFNTTTKAGGKLVGFGNGNERPGSRRDKHIYMTNDGRLVFGVISGSQHVIATGPGFNNGAWHHVVATQGPDGMRLYVDGKLRAHNQSLTTSQKYRGYWQVGGDQPKGGNGPEHVPAWPRRPESWYFKGKIDEVAVYPRALAPAQVARHYTLGTR
ncbi:LamG-like jellyroll fold domain-containing protein [Streptomyces sp. L2]|uniref:LamG-like jellyroll fold domain-containing protein n=1 Tax=Streptomyces sp. L2 TaxID=2162665 RepID=UPI00321FA848